MKLCLLCIGKTDVDFVQEANEIYLNRLKHYIQTELDVIPDQKSWKKMKAPDRVKAEGQAILDKLKPTDAVYLLDDKGKQYSSEEFSELLQKRMNSGVNRVVFVVGGAFGFSEEIYQAYPQKISLSKMTFSHQMIRCFFLEQAYRAMTILKGEPYHNT
jgi:23S rRNA (pseudouridine1915-N3)-methyltransferase